MASIKQHSFRLVPPLDLDTYVPQTRVIYDGNWLIDAHGRSIREGEVLIELVREPFNHYKLTNASGEIVYLLTDAFGSCGIYRDNGDNGGGVVFVCLTSFDSELDELIAAAFGTANMTDSSIDIDTEELFEVLMPEGEAQQ